MSGISYFTLISGRFFYLAVRDLQFLREVFLIILQLMKNCVHESRAAFDPKEHHIVMMLEKYWFIIKPA